MRRTIATVIALTGAVLSLSYAEKANAGVIDWNFSFHLSNGDSGDGILVTQDTPAGGPFLITSIENGLLDGVFPIVLLPPGGTFNDNLLYTSGPLLDGDGLGFTADGAEWAIWSAGGNTVDSWCNNSTNGVDHLCTFASDPNGSVVSFTVEQTAVPEPPALPMMLFGLAGIGYLTRRSRKWIRS